MHKEGSITAVAILQECGKTEIQKRSLLCDERFAFGDSQSLPEVSVYLLYDRLLVRTGFLRVAMSPFRQLMATLSCSSFSCT